jgi:hypothetical protein
MTRTERSHSLRALAKDRSEARNGMDTSVPKGGAGAHNWGSLNAEFAIESEAMLDENAEFEDQAAGGRRLPSDVVTPSVLTQWQRLPLPFFPP